VLADIADGVLALGEHLIPLGADDRHGRIAVGLPTLLRILYYLTSGRCHHLAR
jgi:hypothetical protein